MKKESYKFGVVNIIVFTLITCAYLAIINSFQEYSKLIFLQQIIAKTVCYTQNVLGIEVMLQDTLLTYPNLFRIEITLLCTGINEILFFSLILLGFIGVSMKTKLKGYAIFFPIIIAENMVRIIVIQPLATIFGKNMALTFHDFSFKYGQAVFVTVLVIVWFYCFAGTEFKNSVQNYRLAKQLRQT